MSVQYLIILDVSINRRVSHSHVVVIVVVSTTVLTVEMVVCPGHSAELHRLLWVLRDAGSVVWRFLIS
jgi:hypothetical protein